MADEFYDRNTAFPFVEGLNLAGSIRRGFTLREILI
jgi:hypothetical protein